MAPAPKRRWLRFSLRTLFVVVTVCALVSPALVKAYREWCIPFPEDQPLWYPATAEDWARLKRHSGEYQIPEGLLDELRPNGADPQQL